ncbi:MAG: CYTH and CHAD domain-containing protein [Candidatus Eremiobacteraeota bacterium]|nr:CYTH and CHAD domain-containing protein [Candidatus Eremiobacteraeota bacterium]
MDTHVEQEVKLKVPPRFDLHALEAGVDGYTASPVEEQKLTTVYYDTDDLRLIRWGASLRYRKGHGWTLKLPAGDDDGIASKRVEHTFPDDGGAKPPKEGLELVTAFLRGKQVMPVARLRTVRKSLRLHGAAGEGIAEVVDDTVRVMHDGRVANRFREVEIELLDGASESLLDDLTQWLRDAGAGPPDKTPKAMRALGAAAQVPAELAFPTPTEDSPAGDVVRYALAASVKALLCGDAPLRLNMDAELVHKARVATRKLRSDLRTLLPLMNENWATSLRDDVKWLGDELGAVRDADVLVTRLRRNAMKLPGDDRDAAEAVIDRFEAQSTAARQRLHAILREKRYVKLLDELVEAASNPQLSEDGLCPAADVVPQLVQKPWKKLCKAIDELGEQPDDDMLHQVRIKAKRCRYAAEAVAPVVGKQATRFAKRVAKIQTILGDLHDAVVAEEKQHRIKGDRDEVFVAGALAAMEGLAANEARSSWRKAWKKASKKGLRFWS